MQWLSERDAAVRKYLGQETFLKTKTYDEVASTRNQSVNRREIHARQVEAERASKRQTALAESLDRERRAQDDTLFRPALTSVTTAILTKMNRPKKSAKFDDPAVSQV